MKIIFRQHRFVWILCFVALSNLGLMTYVLYFHESVSSKNSNSDNYDSTSDSNLATFILREFEDFDNDVANTVSNISELFASSSVLVVANNLPYPPLSGFPSKNKVQLITLNISPDKAVALSRPETFIQSDYVVFVPDAVQFIEDRLEYMIRFLEKQQMLDKSVTIAAWSVAKHFNCLSLKVDMKRWTMTYGNLLNSTVCDALSGDRLVLLLRKETLLNFAMPFLRPHYESIFIQNSLRSHKVAVDMDSSFLRTSKEVYRSNKHNKMKHERNDKRRRKEAFSSLGVKLAINAEKSKEWFGCQKNTPRCFGTVTNDMPDYLFKDRWTPPCCLQALRATARHVFRILAAQDVRYWLEGGSLLGAPRNGDIIEWDYDIDIGIHKDDIINSRHLIRSQTESFEDDDGFVWERATEGDFFRVQYSRSNHLHVDIFPFFARNGTMTKNTWFKTHRQDREFPESFLEPIENIRFVGVEACAPNNVKEFLEYKFGVGVIDNPQYPNKRNIR